MLLEKWLLETSSRQGCCTSSCGKYSTYEVPPERCAWGTPSLRLPEALVLLLLFVSHKFPESSGYSILHLKHRGQCSCHSPRGMVTRGAAFRPTQHGLEARRSHVRKFSWFLSWPKLQNADIRGSMMGQAGRCSRWGRRQPWVRDMLTEQAWVEADARPCTAHLQKHPPGEFGFMPGVPFGQPPRGLLGQGLLTPCPRQACLEHSLGFCLHRLLAPLGFKVGVGDCPSKGRGGHLACRKPTWAEEAAHLPSIRHRLPLRTFQNVGCRGRPGGSGPVFGTSGEESSGAIGVIGVAGCQQTLERGPLRQDTQEE